MQVAVPKALMLTSHQIYAKIVFLHVHHVPTPHFANLALSYTSYPLQASV